MTITRSEIRRLARTGGLTPAAIAAIEAAQRTGQVVRDNGASSRPQPLMVESQPSRIGGTEIVAQKPREPREPKLWWVPR